MMKAVQLAYKKTEATVVTVTKPDVVEPDDILVKVQYSALDTAFDQVVNKTFIGSFIHKATDPLYLGWHFSGSVERAGKDALDDFPLGSQVFGHLQYAPETTQGSLVEYIIVKANACAKKPESVNAPLAAASTTEVLTALQALRDEGGLSFTDGKTQKVLINGAGGQVGASAVQIAKKAGAHVTAICSTKDVKRVSDLGADVVVDRKKTKNIFSSLKKSDFDVIFDTPNALSPAKALRFLKPGGNYVMTLPNWGLLWGMIRSMFTTKKVGMVSVKSTKEDLELLGDWLNDGFVVDIDSIFPIKKLETAIFRNRNPSKKGRVVVQVEDGW